MPNVAECRGIMPFELYQIRLLYVSVVLRCKDMFFNLICAMKVIEILKLSRNILETLQKSCVKIDDVRYIEMYEDYLRMQCDGCKKTYIIACLVDFGSDLLANFTSAGLFLLGSALLKKL